MKTFKKKLLAAVTVMALSPLAQAGVISYSDFQGPAITDWYDTLTVAQFDANLGNLDSINITFSAEMFSDLILDNDNTTATTARGTVNVETLGSFLGLGALELSLSATTGFQNLAADDSGDTDAPTLDGTGGLDEYAGLDLSGTDSMTITIDSSHADFLSFIGTGTISTVGLGTLGGYAVSGGGGNVDVNVNTLAKASLNIDYNYTETTNPTPVSEPTSLAILGLGLAGIALRRKKKSL
ncbi:PEP-CTERM sorting domain-containing protein [Colwellia sp. 4_MG-2023]|jgi:hypothetical protein|uniref:PEP-CTERM sorting domain-containing protein n=1 Tax=unclassified Colwellia TaxID=196834 RepID=UPI0026E22858|nr:MULTISPECIES: PEP-CTERM sorting domain-containing protein [unclassified Colwellia]MDO6505656.1 PEP-CTERM sorting domain-containing protein [Colwellia sp. 5_MG-2023]MDO6554048.1 PEP-CTERM sorting domain-containing protein [Colwellia sp. 4_MG-2023]